MPTPFRYGDVVKYIGKNSTWEGTHIIDTVAAIGKDVFEYATDHGAWIPHKDFILVEESSGKSREKLRRILDQEYD